ncbi:MAG: saccharopine dehydrogenase C-terminal domain-containing protein [Bacteroidota bacterium]|nr:saccharopine dehydrogenase C-terminal domain-containing protein [Bacteroidota bacterium]
MNIVVFGAGLVGSAIIHDLCSEPAFSVTAVDIDQSVLDRLAGHERLLRLREDLSDPELVRRIAASFDIAVGAVPGMLGYQVLRAVIEAGTDIVDISFSPEDPFTLDRCATEGGVTAIVDCGIAPGCSNALLGHARSMLDRVHRFACYVGGLPLVRRKPWEYSAVFSPSDVIEEYTRPARLVENGKVITMPALTGVEEIEIEGLGTLEAFNTDGLRTLLVTIDAENMVEKTLRYPGHAQLLRVFRDAGFFRKEPIDINGKPIRPLDVTSALLFPLWKRREEEEDLTVMHVMVEGEKNGSPLRFTYDLLDRYDKRTRTTSMARTTGYTCSVAVRMVAEGIYRRVGISPPEYIGADAAAYAFLTRGLRERSIIFHEKLESPERWEKP